MKVYTCILVLLLLSPDPDTRAHDHCPRFHIAHAYLARSRCPHRRPSSDIHRHPPPIKSSNCLPIPDSQAVLSASIACRAPTSDLFPGDRIITISGSCSSFPLCPSPKSTSCSVLHLPQSSTATLSLAVRSPRHDPRLTRRCTAAFFPHLRTIPTRANSSTTPDLCSCCELDSCSELVLMSWRTFRGPIGNSWFPTLRLSKTF